jgi:hypothetical protein
MPTALPIGYVVTRSTGSAEAVAAHRDRRDRRDRRDPHGHPGRQDPSRVPRNPASPARPDQAPDPKDQATAVDRRGHPDRPDRTPRADGGGSAGPHRRPRPRRRRRPQRRRRCPRRSPPTPRPDKAWGGLPHVQAAGLEAIGTGVRVLGSSPDHAEEQASHQPIGGASRDISYAQNTQANFRLTTRMSVIPAMIATQAATW